MWHKVIHEEKRVFVLDSINPCTFENEMEFEAYKNRPEATMSYDKLGNIVLNKNHKSYTKLKFFLLGFYSLNAYEQKEMRHYFLGCGEVERSELTKKLLEYGLLELNEDEQAAILGRISNDRLKKMFENILERRKQPILIC